MSRQNNRALWVLLLVALFVACIFHWQRDSQEQSHKNTELVMDFSSLVELARAQGEPWQAELKTFSPNGLAFVEMRLDDLESWGICNSYSGVQLRAAGYRGDFDPQHTYVLIWPGAESKLMSAAQLQTALSGTFGSDKVRKVSWEDPRFAGATIFDISLPSRSTSSVGVCLPEWGMIEADKLGQKLWVRPENKARPDIAGIGRYFDSLQRGHKLEGIIFGGTANEAVGYPDEDVLKSTAGLIRQHGWKLGFIELPKATQQKGIETLVRELPTDTVRVFAVPPAQQSTLKPDRVGEMYSLAARERNLTLLYVRPYPYDPSPDKGFENANTDLLAFIRADLADRLKPVAAPFSAEVKVPFWGAALLTLGGAAAFAILLRTFRPKTTLTQALLVCLTAALASGLAALLPGSTPMGVHRITHQWFSLVALGSAFCISTLAVVSQFGRLRAAADAPTPQATLWHSTRAWLLMSVISLSGAWIASAFLQETSYKLGLDVFRGVKLLTVGAPLFITALWAWNGQDRDYWRNLVASPLRLGQLLVLGALGLVGIFYTLRTGNMGGEISGDALDVEKQIRMILDQQLGVRPRFKEFLLAHPAMLLMPLMIRWRWPAATAVLLLAGSTGQAGLLDTFAHIHTPLRVSLIRCVMGVVLGGVLGWFYGLVLIWFRGKFNRSAP